LIFFLRVCFLWVFPLIEPIQGIKFVLLSLRRSRLKQPTPFTRLVLLLGGLLFCFLNKSAQPVAEEDVLSPGRAGKKWAAQFNDEDSKRRAAREAERQVLLFFLGLFMFHSFKGRNRCGKE